MEAMTTKERLHAAIFGQPVDHLPFSPNLAYLFESLPQEYQDMGHMGFSAFVGADLLNRFCPCPVVTKQHDGIRVTSTDEGDRTVSVTETPVGSLRSVYRYSDAGSTRFLVEHPLKTAEDFKVQTWIEEHTGYELDLDPVNRALDSDALCIGMLIPGRCKSAFQFMVEHLVGTQELVYLLYAGGDAVTSLWQTMVANDARAARLAAQSGYELFLTWEDSSTQNYSPDMYEQYVAPEVSAWVDILAEHDKFYIQHACGHLKHLLGTMKGEGILGVESLSPKPTGDITIEEARAVLGGDAVIIGGIEPTMFLNLDTEDLAGYVEKTIEEARGGPYVLGNSDSCPPGVTVEKMRLAADIARCTAW